MNVPRLPLRLVARSSVLAILAILALTSAVAAGDFRGDTSTTIGENETIDDDLYVGAGTVSIAGTVNGDATVAAGTVTITGTVDGSLNVAGGTIDVLGDVTGAVRVSGGTVRIAGTVGRDVVIFGGTTTIEPDAEIGGDVAGAGGSVTVSGTVAGDLLAAAGTIEVRGTIDGLIDVAVGDLVIGPDAVVGGDVTYTSEREARIEDGSQIGGSVQRREPSDDSAGSMLTNNPVISYFGLLIGMLLLGYGLLAVRPRLVIGSAEVLRGSPLPTLGVGALAWVGQFVLITILIIAGIILAVAAGAIGGGFVIAALVVMLLMVLAILLASVPVAMAIGRLVMPGEDRSAYLAYLVGAAILALVLVAGGYVPVLGGLLFLLVWILGLGAFVLYLWRTRREPMVLVSPPPPTAPAAAAPPA